MKSEDKAGLQLMATMVAMDHIELPIRAMASIVQDPAPELSPKVLEVCKLAVEFIEKVRGLVDNWDAAKAGPQ